MTDDMVNSVLFFNICGAVDIFITAVVIYTGVGGEANSFYNWVTPDWLMLLYMIVLNLIVCATAVLVVPYLKEYSFWVKSLFYGSGVGRFIFGAGSGILILISAGVV